MESSQLIEFTNKTSSSFTRILDLDKGDDDSHNLDDASILARLSIPGFLQLKRIFTENFTSGGRYYGRHQTLPSDIRSCLTINGEPVVELDYAGLHPCLVYHERKLRPPANVYLVPKQENPALREMFKLCWLVAMNAESKNGAAKAVFQKLGRAKCERLLKGTPYWREGRKRKDASLEFRPEVSLRAVLDALLELHAPIADSLFRGVGLHLQYLNSQIIGAVLWSLAREGIPALPVHDSVIVQAKYEELLRAEMQRAYQKEMGADIEIE